VDPRILPLSAATAWVERTAPRAAAASEERVVELEVRYDGPDLADAARLTGRTEADVVGFHSGTSWRVAFGGFAPGFAYLVPDGPPLDVPRRTTPRTAVPAGSVGLAGGFSGVYPRESPGGWQLIGSTDAELWDETADPPALLRPGTVVRFREVR
jgi:KipI family sensor histidine kinase inhibitor